MRLATFWLLVMAAFAAAAQDGDSEEAASRAEDIDFVGSTEKCIHVRRIRRTKVIDDSTIAFYLRNREVYLNMLPRRCPDLARHERFAYQARGGRLCSVDTINVLVQFGTRLESGFTCRLGEFYLSDEESVQLMIDAAEQRGRTSPVTAEPVELPEEEAEESDEQ